MCNHIWKTVNDVRVCQRCGLTVRRDGGRVIFDRKLPSIGQKGNKKQ